MTTQKPKWWADARTILNDILAASVACTQSRPIYTIALEIPCFVAGKYVATDCKPNSFRTWMWFVSWTNLKVNDLLLTHVKLRYLVTMHMLRFYIFKKRNRTFKKNCSCQLFIRMHTLQKFIFLLSGKEREKNSIFRIDQNASEATHHPGVVFEPCEQNGRNFFRTVATFRSSSSPYTFWNAPDLGVVCIKKLVAAFTFSMWRKWAQGSRMRL